ncbi:cip1-interacting zinc finger protein isoform X2 [Hemicordylus capensis]|nr:cip1-interacting zinc finger protein isoform X2 [Hemicordylus capensis]XP_053138400.1 cip1-interacting zinc finger protein isoform X2 [Hemicordylus capensis]XP_053138401.1 cip1-interacting zinc finger protein isoform X2 [Hemicordylus capensis]XP_053138402.1 cip1-interacting zinc finger protein isoform X2 [Hemicordylus capensis]
MFNQQQFQQQLLQHLLQHQTQQQQPPPPVSRGVTPSQQQQMLNLRATNQASLLSANPMLQRALLMQQVQGNLRGFNLAAAPMLQQFFPQATRHSLLGPPPVGVSLKPTRLAFPGLPFQRQNRTFRTDFPRVPERKREADSALLSSSSSQGQGADESVPGLEVSVGQAGSEQPSSSPSNTQTQPSPDGEPAIKRLRSGDEDSVPDDTACLEQTEESHTQPHREETDHGREDLADDISKEQNFSEEPKPSEVVSSAGSLKVTIQQSSESRAISTTALKPAHWTSEMGTAETSPESALKFYCYICKTNCCNQQNFQAHMAGVEHQQRLQEIQHRSNICFVSLLPMVKEQKPLAEKDGDSQQRWCNTCQIHFTGDLIKHRRTQEHKLAKRSLRPFCTVCSRHFKTPRKFVEHMKSLEHKQKAKEVRLGEKEQGGPEDSEELITVDAVGCFEDDEEEEEEEDDDEVGEEEDSEVAFKEASLEEVEGNEKYCPDTIYGPDFLVPVAGFLCRLCHKFYHSDSATRFAHCKSLMHFENFQRYKAARFQAAAALAEASCPQQELRELQNPPAAKTEDKTTIAGAGEAAVMLIEACRSPKAEDVSLAQAGNQAAVETDDICGALVVEDGEGKNSFSTLEDGSLHKDAAAMEEEFRLCTRKEEAASETKQEGITGRVSADEEEPGAEALDSQGLEKEAEFPSLPKGEASPGHRRSTRRRVR